MRVLIVTLGTRGDLELFLSLAHELAGRGHDPLLATSGFHAGRLAEAGVQWVKIGRGSFNDVFSALRGLEPVESGAERTRLFVKRWLRPELAAASDRISELAAKTDYFVSNLRIAVRRDGRVLPGASVTYDPPMRVEDLTKLGVAVHGPRILELVALNRRLVDAGGAWDPKFRFTGFWETVSPSGWAPSADLARCLEEGPPPLAVTLGSMVTFDAERLVARLVDALERTGQRAIVVGGWARLDRLTASPGTLLFASEIPYAWLFPRTCGVIHHGGCGTVSAVLRAGKPSILLPQIACQEILASMLCRENLVAAVLDTRTATRDAWAGAIERMVSDRRMIEQAAAWSAVVAADGGVRAAADLIEQHRDEIGSRAE